MAAVKLKNPARHVIQKIPVVRDGNDGAGILLQIALEPRNGFGIQMVGGLVQQQHFRLGKQQPTQRDPPAFPTRKMLDFRLPGWQTKRISGYLELAFDFPCADGVNFGL